MTNLSSKVLNNDIDIEISNIISKEISRQNMQITLIASENYASPAVIHAMANVLTNKYAEGYPGHRYYEGCENADLIESIAKERLNQVFGSSYCNVQPHSGVQANTGVFLAILKPRDKILSMNLKDGGHLSHGNIMNLSGKYYEIHSYCVDEKTEMLDYENIRALTKKVRPKLIIAGASSYPRSIDFAKFREIADEVGAYLMADIAHIAGLIAGDVHPSSIGIADFTTGTTHKTLRGPRGGFVIAEPKYQHLIDEAMFPGTQGGPLMHIIAAKAVSFAEVLAPSFKDYARRIVENSKTLCASLKDAGFKIVSGGTDNHMFLIDLRPLELTGSQVSQALASVGLVVNKNVIPFDKLSPSLTSGIRIGSPSVTSRGMGKEEMLQIGELIAATIENIDDLSKLKEISKKVFSLAKAFPVYETL